MRILRSAQNDRRCGYTLAELAIVLTIVAVVIGMSVSAGMTQLEATRISGTKNSLETVRGALLLYQKKHGRYPCPAAPADLPAAATYGVEVAGGCGGACPAGLVCTGNAVIGAMPFKTALTNPETTIDTYNRKITYVVDKYHTQTSLTHPGTLKIRSAGGQEITASPALSDAIFVLISHGQDGGGAYLPASGQRITCVAGHADTSNCDNADDIFIDERINNAEIAVNYFDDIVVWQTQENLSGDIVYVADTSNHRVQTFGGSGVYQSQFGTFGSGNGQFILPTGIAIDGGGNLFVVDPGNYRVQKFDSSGVYQSQFGTLGIGNGQFATPTGIAIDGGGNLFVVDWNIDRVQKFDSNGVYISQFGSTGSGPGQLDGPWGIAIDSSGNLWITDRGNNRVQKFTSRGVYLSQFGSFGTGNGQFNQPIGIAIDSGGNLWVTDANNNRVQKFNSLGVYLSQFGSGPGSGNGAFAGPYGVAIDGGGNLWVGDFFNRRMQAFSSSGIYLSQFGGSGSGSGQFVDPYGIAIGRRR